MLLSTGAKVHSSKSPVLDDLKLWNGYVGEEHVVNAFPPGAGNPGSIDDR